MLESAIAALLLLFTPEGALFLAIGVVIGLAFGAIPGLGGTTAIALLIPLTYGMQPETALTLIGGVMGSVAFGGSISAILLNTPGIPPNAATCLDGFPMAQQGKAGAAIGAAATASSLGGLIGVAILIAVIPLAREIVLLFGPPEFFALAMLGLGAIALSTGGHFLRGLGVPRTTFWGPQNVVGASPPRLPVTFVVTKKTSRKSTYAENGDKGVIRRLSRGSQEALRRLSRGSLL